jgi:phage terminase large subunit GpA-like protein
MSFETLEEIVIACADQLRPPERLSVSDAAAKYRKVNSPGAYVGDWLNSTTPYMREPMDVFASTEFSGIAFVGPAQCAKTDGLIINTTLYSVKIDPMDMMIVCPTNTAARDFSMRRIDRLNRDSEAVGEMMIPGSANDNKFDKHYKNGMMLSISWPTPTELAGKPIPRVVLTDRDRMPDDVEGDGEPFDLAMKRTTTFGSNAMCLVESSPSREITDIKYILRTPHEAPPAPGIIGLYNRGDRRRWYWPCPECDRYFEGKFEMLKYRREEGMSNTEAAESTRMECPHCGHHIHGDHRYEMNEWGMWIKDGEYINKFGKRCGQGMKSLIASFWLRGVAAAFVTWKKLVNMYLDAMDEFERTGSEEALKKFYNNDLGEPYISKAQQELRVPETLKARATKVPEHLIRTVPEHVRFLAATVDVQKGAFVVQVNGIKPGAPFDIEVIDRFEIKKSQRLDEDGHPLPVRPATYTEDWDLLVEQVMNLEYELSDGSGRKMMIKITGCDSGGKAGVTGKAYEFWRRLRNQGAANRFVLLKGDGKPGQPRTRVSFPDSERKDSKTFARGDVPVLMLNSNVLKDDLNGRLDSLEPGKGMITFPAWLPDSWFAELCAEVREMKGWLKVNTRNEAWDLLYYCIGLCVSTYVRVESLDWSNPPTWAAEWDQNDFVRKADEENPYGNRVKSEPDFAAMAQALA